MELPGAVLSCSSPAHPQGTHKEGNEEHADAGKEEIQQALHDNAEDTQRNRQEYQQYKNNHPTLRLTELRSGALTVRHSVPEPDRDTLEAGI
jgi:hypothetical protein